MSLKVAISDISNEEVRCPKCDWLGKLSDLKTHKDICPKVKISCQLCDLEVERCLILVHKDKCPERKINCDKCGDPMPAKELTEHRKICPKRISNCSFLYCNFEAPADQIKEHEKDLSHHIAFYINTINMFKAENQKLIDQVKKQDVENSIAFICKLKTQYDKGYDDGYNDKCKESKSKSKQKKKVKKSSEYCSSSSDECPY